MKKQLAIMVASLMLPGTSSLAVTERAACEIWQEVITVLPKSKAWVRSEVTANRNAPRRPPGAYARDRVARVVDYRRTDVSIVLSKSRPGTQRMFNTETTFEVTFQKLPCNE